VEVTIYRWVVRTVGESRIIIVWARDEDEVIRILDRHGERACQIIAADPAGDDADYPEAL
jgi:hypothetical protein